MLAENAWGHRNLNVSPKSHQRLLTYEHAQLGSHTVLWIYLTLLIDLFSLCGLLSHFWSRVIFLRIVRFFVLGVSIFMRLLMRMTRGLRWDNKPPELKRSIDVQFCVIRLISAAWFESACTDHQNIKRCQPEKAAAIFVHYLRNQQLLTWMSYSPGGDVTLITLE